jgi:hypothetical protein
MCTFVEHENEIKNALSGLLEKSISPNILCIKALASFLSRGAAFKVSETEKQHAKNHTKHNRFCNITRRWNNLILNNSFTSSCAKEEEEKHGNGLKNDLLLETYRFTSIEC